MADTTTATPFGWLATRGDGGTELFAGAKPANPSAYASVVDLDTVDDFMAAQAGLRSLTRPVDLAYYAENVFSRLIATGRTFNVAASGAPAVNVLCDGTGSTMGNLAVLTLFGQENPNGTKTWLDNNKVSTVVTGSQFVTLTTLVGTWSDDLYAALGAVLTGINASPATITTTAQIDAALGGVTS